ncbi:MAG TPA: hypothetical protein VH025_02015 [Solirubrobacteraceae bacterium]|nr:hypothetical protein [Solirubrobacteraceae bacterium]
MLDERRPTTTPAPRAVTDTAIERLEEAGAELARSWALALIRNRAPEAMGEVRLSEIAADGPLLFTQIIGALRSDAELERLAGASAARGGAREEAEPALRLCAMAGAADAPAALEAVELLRAVIAEALAGTAVPEPGERAAARHAAEVSGRLAHISLRLLGAAVTAMPGICTGPASDAADELVVNVAERTQSRTTARAHASTRAVIVDEHAAPPSPAREVPPREIAVRDQRRGEGAVAWVGSIGRQLNRFREDGLAFSVLLVEILEIERLRRDRSPDALAGLSDRLEAVLSAELRHADGDTYGREAGERADPAGAGKLTRQRPGRYWLLVPGTDRLGARRLAARIAQASAESLERGGAGVAIAVGVAVCPEDGIEAATLAAQADLALSGDRAGAGATN